MTSIIIIGRNQKKLLEKFRGETTGHGANIIRICKRWF